METGTEEFLPPMDLAKIKEILPHRYPMLMIDKIVDITPNDGAMGVKNVTANEHFFEGHFPDLPVMPGVLIVEAMAQTAAAYTAYAYNIDTSGQVVLFMGVDKAKFRKPVVPGDRLCLHVKVARRRQPVYRYTAEAKVDGAVVAEAEFAAMIVDPKERT